MITTIATLAALVLNPSAHAREAKVNQDLSGDNTGKVVELSGHARNLTRNEDLKLGSTVALGDHIKTESDGLVRATLGNDVAIQIGPSSEIALEESAATASGWSATIITGKLLSAVRKTASVLIGTIKVPKFEVRAASSVMGIRGTVTFVSHTPGKPTFVCVCMGTADLKTGPLAERHTFVTKHHDSPQVFDDEGRPSDKKLEADYSHHTDADMNSLSKLANR